MVTKNIRKAFLAVLVIACVCLCSCSPYKSKYSATAFVHSNTSDSAFMDFWQFEGTMVFKLKCSDPNGARLKYEGKLGSGELIVYIDTDGKEEDLFSLVSDEIRETTSIDVEAGTIYIIVVTSGQCEDGHLKFDIVGHTELIG